VGTLEALMGRKNSCENAYSNGWNILSKRILSLFLYLRDFSVQCFADTAKKFIPAKLFHAIDIAIYLVTRDEV
jgi:hypothetical protein